eukprot:gb/GEZN01003376.1/.p1 GENE.gb/GEZN01003376.1/~~gb/GEZN01003376.1/.p1  ORF type:complete len:533 (-),score=52.63 gb/GEZN01003376.1/:592-2067(-)
MEPEGYFIACAKNGFHFIDPVNHTIVKTIPNPRKSRCGDGVYLRNLPQTKHYYGQAMMDIDEIWFINTDTMELEGAVRAGGKPVHIYAIQRRDEFWTHSDDTSTFDVVNANEIGYLHHADYKVHLEQTGHGKLLFDPYLVDVAYSTNVNEGGIYEIHLALKTDLIWYNFSNSAPVGKKCTGTHGIAYSDLNENLYVECSGSGGWDKETNDGSGLWEFSTQTGKVVKVWDGFLGQVYCPLEEDYIIAVNKLNDIVHVLHPEEDHTDDSFVDFKVPGHPDQTQWIPKDSSMKYGTGKFHDYELWFSQTQDDRSVGVAWIDLQEVVDYEGGQPVPQANVITAGMIKRGYTPYNTYRSIARGGNWVATEVHIPVMGVAIFDVSKHELVTIVEGIEEAGHVSWIPKHSDEVGYKLAKEVSRLENIIEGKHNTPRAMGGDFLVIVTLLISVAALVLAVYLVCSRPSSPRAYNYKRVVPTANNGVSISVDSDNEHPEA